MLPELPSRVRDFLDEVPDDMLPAYIYDLQGLHHHAQQIRSALPPSVQWQYVAKANPDAHLLQTLAPHVNGFEVSSLGELRHVVAAVPEMPIAFGSPAKTMVDIEHAVSARVSRFHVEGLQELAMLAHAASRLGSAVDVLLRVNMDVDVTGAVLAMGGRPSPFGFDEASIGMAVDFIRSTSELRLRGLHAHVASGLDAPEMGALAGRLIRRARRILPEGTEQPMEINIGGGMAVDYRQPSRRFDWGHYGELLGTLTSESEILRIEPGRSVTAYCGWYITRVVDVRRSYGKTFAVLDGGTHHLRTPAAKGHSQPLTLLRREPWPHRWDRPSARGEQVTFVGQLCTPKDVLASDVPVVEVSAGDTVAFSLAGAYAWNISHHGFLMHRQPTFHYLGETGGNLDG